MRNRLSDLTASRAAMLIEHGEIAAVDLVRDCVERIREQENSIHAWTCLDAQSAIDQAEKARSTHADSIISGIPIGIKDNIDTRDFVTTYGSKAYHQHQPTVDATCVSLSKRAGAIILGKTASTEFAFRTAGPCRNPHNLDHSPGGSSSGSAAAVAANMVPLAIGTQTGGSVIRPAAYCGVYGFKPRYGDLSFAGAKNFAPSFDTLGVMGRCLDDLLLFYSAIQQTSFSPIDSRQISNPRIAVYRTAFWDEAQPSAHASFENMLKRLSSAGASLHETRLDGLDVNMLHASWVINKYEGSRQFAQVMQEQGGQLSPAIHALVTEGLAIEQGHYHEARLIIENARHTLHQTLGQYDAIVTLSSPGEAPQGLADTGPVTFNFIWTACHMAAVNLPFYFGPNDLPIGIQVVSPSWDYRSFFETTDWIDRNMRD